MSRYQYKIIPRSTKRQKTQFKETEPTPKLGMTEMLELSDREFETTMINIPKTLLNKVDSMHKQMDSVSKEMKILKKLKRNARDKKIM